METATLRSVLDGVAGLMGSEPFAVGDPDFISAVASLNRHLRRGWQHDFWPEWTPTELRAYRNDWQSGPVYPAGSEIYLPANGTYYSANSAPNNPLAGESPLTAPTKWAALTSFARYVAADQTGKTPIGDVQRMCRNNPDLYPERPGELVHTVTNLGYVPRGAVGAQIYVTFRLRAPEFTSTAWNTGTTYALNALVYDDATGDCYKAIQPGNAHAVADATYWTKVLFPARLKSFVVAAVYADMQRGDDQTGKALAESNNANLELILAHDAAFGGQG